MRMTAGAPALLAAVALVLTGCGGPGGRYGGETTGSHGTGQAVGHTGWAVAPDGPTITEVPDTGAGFSY